MTASRSRANLTGAASAAALVPDAPIPDPAGMDRVKQLHAQLATVVSTLNDKVSSVLKKQESEFLRAYRAHMYNVQKELAQLRAKADDAALQLAKNEKIRQLIYIEELVRNFRIYWKAHKINPSLAPVLVDNFETVWRANMDSLNIAPYIDQCSYEVGSLLVEIFTKNEGYADARKLLFLKFCTLNPDKILANIRPFVDASFADSLVVVACKNDPEQLYDYSYSTRTPEGKLIQRNTNPMVKAIVQLSKIPNALLYYP
ncbi:MAG: hypothetical protein EOO65_06230, partial [Methanosarcinales archaeon]